MVNVTGIIILLVVIVVSMTLHEAMHAFVGYALGDDTARQQGRLSFNPLKHIDPFMTILLPFVMVMLGAPPFGAAKPVPFNPQRLRHGEWGMLMVALAGPLMNLLLAFICFGIGVVSGIITHAGIQNSLIGSFVGSMVFVNLGFFVFNMLPIPPLDGSRLLYVLAPDIVRRRMEWLEQYGTLLVFGLVVVMSPLISRMMRLMINAIIGGFSWIFGV